MTPERAYDYCEKYGRNEDLEKIILTDPHLAHCYAYYIINGRWKEAENVIATDSFWAYNYARIVIEGKLPEHMHNMMLLHADDWAKEYLEFINKPPNV